MKIKMKPLFAFICVLVIMVLFIPFAKVNAVETKYQGENVETSQVYTCAYEDYTLYVKIEANKCLISDDNNVWIETQATTEGNCLYITIEDEVGLFVINNDNTLTFVKSEVIETPTQPEPTPTTTNNEELSKEDIEEIVKNGLAAAGLDTEQIQALQDLYKTMTSQDLSFKEKIVYLVIVILASLGVSSSVLAIFYYSLKNRNQTGIKQVDTMLDAVEKATKELVDAKEKQQLTDEKLEATTKALNQALDYLTERDRKIVEALGEE